MSTQTRLLLIGALVLLLLLGGASLVELVASGGTALVTLTLDSSGTVTESPDSIAMRLGVSTPVAALACCISSEAGGEPDAVKVAVGWCIVNLGGGDPANVMSVLAPKGTFGRQGAQGRQASTRLGPNSTALAFASGIADGSIPDPTGGCIQFDSPQAQRALLARDPSYTKTPEQVAAQREAEGKEMVTVPGVDADRFRMWRYA